MNTLNELKPFKKIGKGSEGIIILTHDKKYTVKIYISDYLKSIMFFNVVKYLQECKLPKTIYKSYVFTHRENSLNRYIDNLPNHFSYKDENNLKSLSSKYKMKKKLFEIMKTYDNSLNNFMDELKIKNIDSDLKISIINSLFQQGIITIYWLYMNKGIIHGDINSNNFFIQKTSKENLNITINEIKYSIKLFGYYLVLGDFGYGKSIELISFDKNPDKKDLTRLSNIFNPLSEIKDFISLFKKIYLDYNVNVKISNYKLLNCDGDYELRTSYKTMIKSYISKNDELENDIKIFKKLFSDYMHSYIFSKF